MDKIKALAEKYPKVTVIVGIAFVLFVATQLWPYVSG